MKGLVAQSCGVRSRKPCLLGHSDGATIAALYAGLVQDARVREAYRRGDLKTRLSKYHLDPDVAFHGMRDVFCTIVHVMLPSL